MTSSSTPGVTQRQPELDGQVVVVIGGSAGIGLETARRARAQGAEVVLTGRNPDRLDHAAVEVGAHRTAAFDANDTVALATFFAGLPAPIDHVMVTAGGPSYRPLLDMDPDEVREALSSHVALGLEVARNAVPKMRPGGTLILMGGTRGPAHRSSARNRLRRHRDPAAVHRSPRSGDRPRARQPHRSRFCRHPVVGIPAR
jgi:NAD(P)-dependent dehydrogenase (short-subunit alcohol dehydrogenase family)